MEQITISEQTNGIEFRWSPSNKSVSFLHNRIKSILIENDALQGDYRFIIEGGCEPIKFFFKQVVTPSVATPDLLRTQIMAWAEDI